MTRRPIFAAAVAALGLIGLFEPSRAAAQTAQPGAVPIAVAELEYVDTSGEAKDQTADHQRRSREFADALRRDLAASGKYRVVAVACGAEPCAAGDHPLAVRKAAREAGAKLVVIGSVRKMSTLVQWATIQVVDEEEDRVVLARLLTFRGDDDNAWRRAEAFIANDIFETAPQPDRSAAAPIKLAVFEFELEDFSGGASLIPESDIDVEQLRLATEAARKLIAESGRYSLVDVSGADDEAAKNRSLRQCDGCDAAIARKLGADQSLIGIVTRISQTDYAVTYRLRDARTGATLSVQQTDLRVGANYSWNRGAAWLIKNRLLQTQDQP